MNKAPVRTLQKHIKNLAKQYHPDRGGDKDKFQEINEAHDTLKIHRNDTTTIP